jgi:predicted ester cyclase
MKGFDTQYTDLPDYIRKITQEIWEGRGITTLRRYYAKDIIMRMPMGIARGNQSVIDGTLATIAEFPDRQLLAEDVIWSGDEDYGFLSSHRLTSTATHTGFGIFGPPTGRRIAVRAIADCAAKDNVIYDEWLTRDASAIAIQLGLDPVDFARTLIAREGGAKSANRPFTPEMDVLGGYRARGNANPWGQRLADILAQIMDKDFSVIGREYDRAVRVEHPGLCGGWGHPAADSAWLRIRAAFPTARFEIHHIIGREDVGQPIRAAVRWSLTGTHDGFGAYGTPSAAAIYLMGITHAEWGPWGLRREFTVFDEIAVWKQILMHTGAHEA